MATGASQLAATYISGFLTRSLTPDPAAAVPGGYVVVNISATDDHYVGLPTNAAALNGGRAFAGISQGFNTTTATGGTQVPDNGLPCAIDGIAKAALKASTACQVGQDAAYDPADGGVVVPYTNQKQVKIGKFVDTRASNASVQLVGVLLTPGAASGVSEGLLLFADPQAGTASSTAENAYSNATLTIPANFLKAGDVIEYGAALDVSSQNATDKLIVRWKIGSTTIAQTPSSYDPGTGDDIVLRGSIAVDDIGATATPNCSATIAYGALGSAGAITQGVVFPSTDTTAAISITLTAQWDASSASNVCDLKNAYARLIRKAA